MANHVYNNLLNKLPAGTAGWGPTWTATLVNAGYTFAATDSTTAALAGDGLTGAVDQTLAGQVVNANGICVANSVVFTGVAAAQTLHSIVIYITDSGPILHLMLYYDTGTGLPLTTSGGTITVDWNSTAVAGTLFTVTGP
jgi:hypothetical protein